MNSSELSYDEIWMGEALRQAECAGRMGEVPVGALVVSEAGEVLGRGHNRSITDADPSAHAEIVVLRAAGQAGANYRLTGAVLYVTLEPCLMCVGAAVHARIGRLVYGAADPRAGCLGGAFDMRTMDFLNHRFAVTGGVCETQCSELLTEFFQARRKDSVTSAGGEREPSIRGYNASTPKGGVS